MIPFFLESFIDYAVKKWGSRTEALMNTILIIFSIVVVGLAVCSTVSIVHKDEKGNKYCTTMLGERTDCQK